MANEFQAGKLILSQIGMFNEASILLCNKVEPALLGAIDECVEKFVKAEKWIAITKFAEENDCWLAPAQWNVGEKKTKLDPKAWFKIDCTIDKDNNYWAALFCNQPSEVEIGFMFSSDESIFGKRRAWNQYFGSINKSSIVDLKKEGFKIVDNDEGKKTFLLPIHLDAQTLAETWGNDGKFSDVDPCFKPVRVALEKLKAALPIFEAILKACPTKP